MMARKLSPEAAALERMVGHQPGKAGAAMLEAAVQGKMTPEQWAAFEARSKFRNRAPGT